jgi:DNA-binding XRE family transcriptional regulator
MTSSIDKEKLAEKMAEDLMVLRTKLRLKQSELAEKVGVSRQTLLEIEKGKRAMQWNTFLALLSVFREDSSTSGLLEHFEIYTPELGRYLVTPSDENKDGLSDGK